MKLMKRGILILFLFSLLFISSCDSKINFFTKEITLIWEKEVNTFAHSSPDYADLNKDGVEDVIIVGGTIPFFGSLIALNGVDGSVLWEKPLPNFSSATPAKLESSGDDITDFVIGISADTNTDLTSRDPELSDLIMVNGKDGSLLWSFRKQNINFTFSDTHFSSAVVLDDRNEDGVEDIIILQSGGFDDIRSDNLGWDDTQRPTSSLFIVSGKDGKILQQKNVDDGKESYATPAVSSKLGLIILGTGGETISGNLIALDYFTLEEIWRVPSYGMGFISSPVLSEDERYVFGISYNGEIFKIDALRGNIIWNKIWFDSIVYASPTLGKFNEDEHIDVVALINSDRYSNIFIIDGFNGEIISEFEKSKGTIPTPLVLDYNNDGIDDLLTLMNTGCRMEGNGPPDCSGSLLQIWDVGSSKKILDIKRLPGSLATPFLRDLDNDKELDLLINVIGKVFRYEFNLDVDAINMTWDHFRGPFRQGRI